ASPPINACRRFAAATSRRNLSRQARPRRIVEQSARSQPHRWSAATMLVERHKGSVVGPRLGPALLWVVAFIQPAAAQNAHFGGFDCFRDCTSHAAGYRWAEREAVTRVGECRGLSLQ